jgi:hypothetical protein
MTAQNVRSQDSGHDGRLHIYALGQTVRLIGGVPLPRAAEFYRITATLPPRDGSPQYRIRADSENYERVAKQESLVPIAASLVEGTFRS